MDFQTQCVRSKPSLVSSVTAVRSGFVIVHDTKPGRIYLKKINRTLRSYQIWQRYLFLSVSVGDIRYELALRADLCAVRGMCFSVRCQYSIFALSLGLTCPGPSFLPTTESTLSLDSEKWEIIG